VELPPRTHARRPARRLAFVVMQVRAVAQCASIYAMTANVCLGASMAAADEAEACRFWRGAQQTVTPRGTRSQRVAAERPPRRCKCSIGFALAPCAFRPPQLQLCPWPYSIRS
jgi:hypothetical protein